MSELAFPADLLLRGLADHVWQSTIVAAGAALLVLAFRRHRADVRAAIWLAASLKFLVPFVAIAALGRLAPWPELPGVAPPGAVAAVQAISQPFAPVRWDTSERTSGGAADITPSLAPVIVLSLWAAGSACVLGMLITRFRRSRLTMRDARSMDSGREVEALSRLLNRGRRPRALEIRSSASRVSPCVVGLWHPKLIWPAGLSDRLTDTQLAAVVAHEICHVRRRDNLAASGLTIVQTLFWFHPLVWWLGSRWSHERERACDEHVLARGDDPEIYADGVLKVGEYCLGGATVLEHAGITGSRLVERMEAIMSQPTPKALGARGRALLAVVCGMVFISAVMFGGATLAGSPVGLDAVSVPDQPEFAAEPTAATSQGVPQVVTAGPSGLSGVVVDPSGGVVPGATVIVSLAGKTVPERSIYTNASGRFSIGDLPAGEYDVKVQLPGFRTATRRARVGDEPGSGLRVELAMGSVAEQVTIRGAAVAEAAPPVPEGEWQEKLNQNPGNAEVYFELAGLYYRHERFLESEALVEQALRLLARSVTDQPPADTRAGAVGSIRVGGSIKEPRKIRDVRPVYPATARAANVSGVVILEATIGRDGAVRNLKVLRSVPELDRAALGAARLWRFTPTLLNGQPIEVGMSITMNFEAPAR